MRVPRVLVVAGVSSGVGKTTVTLGLLEALRRRGLTVQAFKAGPDFIDPGFHEVVTGRPSYNLDGWMCGRDQVLDTVARHAADADLALVEGVMGCFDGVDGTSEEGSTAQVAKWLGAPVVLVIDASSQSRSAGAVVLGFERFDPDLPIGAVIANRVAGEVHARWVCDAITSSCRAVPVGAIRRDEAVALPERHLGLVTAAEGPLTRELRRRLAEVIERSVDLERLLEIAAPVRNPPRASPAAASPPSVRIGVARDAAFQFYYAENLDLLRAAGAELVFWSPVTDGELPHVDGLYFGGGYPELHAARLAANANLLKAVRRFAEAGRPIYAECGGLMYLAEAIEDLDGATHPMVGLLPTTVRMRPPRLTLGYTSVVLTAAAPIGSAGTTARGHEFHYSSLNPVPDSVPRVYRVSRRRGGDERAEGYLVGRTLMSYVHLHFASNPDIARWFVGSCAGEGR
ncbi:MAG: cobyrinate a,c-diamide synthase [Candidatus Rokubacteria bacterium]|nr:cobyrinate a,c-diamide synthase [Candidatus Rokubacteria bacterium]